MCQRLANGCQLVLRNWKRIKLQKDFWGVDKRKGLEFWGCREDLACNLLGKNSLSPSPAPSSSSSTLYSFTFPYHTKIYYRIILSIKALKFYTHPCIPAIKHVMKMTSRKFDKLYVCEALRNRVHNGGITLFLLKLQYFTKEICIKIA
uniref:Uncharacterized protein n=1 Tax=Glossina pallidipes TaxID=7398 RepID=A0A1A9Z9B1_GLOPL